MKARIKHLILLIILIGIDQVIKYWVRTVLIDRNPIVIIPKVLILQFQKNDGAVWGLMSGRVDFLKIFTVIILIFIIYLYFKIPNAKKLNLLKLITVFIVAGAAGNLIDRFYLRYVVDFIYFEIIDFPLFNFADSYLTVASFLLIILSFFYFKDEDFAFLGQAFKRKKSDKTIAEVENADDENKKEIVEKILDETTEKTTDK